MAQGITLVKAGIQDELMAIVSRGRSISTFLDRVIWPKYQQAQIERWQSENSTQGATWKALEPNYAKRKLTKFAAYPGSGNAMMVATSRLSQGAQGRDGAYFGRLVEETGLTVAINTSELPYAAYAGKVRPFMAFSHEQVGEWTAAVAQYIMKGKE